MNLISQMIRYGTVLLALAGFFAIFNVYRVQANTSVKQQSEPPVALPIKPFVHAVAATGIIEGLSENVSIGVPESGLVEEVFVQVNQVVKKGQALMKLDDRHLQSEKIIVLAQVQSAQARLAVSQAQLQKAHTQQARLEGIKDQRAIRAEDLENSKQDVMIARAQLLEAEAQLSSSEAGLKSLELRISRLTLLAPKDATVIQINTRSGELVSTNPRLAAIVLGDLSALQIRADVDEQNAVRIRPNQSAYAYLKGDPSVRFELKFTRIEPYMIPKTSLTGASTERVDTRVLQIIYSFEQQVDLPVYVGQQVDVMIEAPKTKPKN